MKKAEKANCVTVLMPCFNASQYLAEALLSILNQSHQNLKIILLDDGSTDDSLQIAQKLALSDNRLEIHRHEQNLGIIKSRNKLLSLCDTDYAAWMDCDDIAHPERIAKQLQFMLSHADHIACTCHYVRRGLGEDKIITIPSHTISREYLLFYNYVLNPGSFFDVIRCKQNKVQFREWISGASDYLFWVELVKFGQIGVIDEVLMTYRIHPAQETNAQKQRQLNGCLQIVQAQLSQLQCHAEQQDLARMLIYPADILNLVYNMSFLKRSEHITKTLLSAPALVNYDTVLIKQLLFDMYRRQAWRVGVLGFWRFVLFYKIKGLRNCRGFGLDLLMQAIKQDWAHLLIKFKGKR